jgi:hypothetical protein
MVQFLDLADICLESSQPSLCRKFVGAGVVASLAKGNGEPLRDTTMSCSPFMDWERAPPRECRLVCSRTGCDSSG